MQGRFGAALVGTRGIAAKTDRFPLLLKLLDPQSDLSVQVHPGDDDPALPPGELGKTEMWVVLDAPPGARVVYGLQEGVTPDAFAAAIRAGKTMDALRQIPVQAGDVLYVPAGTVHALGSGVLVAEIQQSSDTTYRVYDYGRPGLDGRPRALHVEQALRVIRYGPAPRPARPAWPDPHHWLPIGRSPYFAVDHGECQGEWPQATTPDTCQVIVVLEGAGAIAWDGGEEPIPAGSALLVPAALGSYHLAGRFRALRITLP